MAASTRAPQGGAWRLPLQIPSTVRPASHDMAEAVLITSVAVKEETHDLFFETDESDSDDEACGRRVDAETLQATIFDGYGGDRKAEQDSGLAMIRDLLIAGQSGGTACLICLERVNRQHHIWDCKSGCHGIFHLTCIQAWARQALVAAEQRATSRLPEPNFPGVAANAARWHCPKCRAEYSRFNIPKEYRCFCCKEVNPDNNLWLAPHTCGERCGRQLEGECGHECKLLCHPGPCPPCPQLVRSECFCGKTAEVRRCGHREFSCGRICGDSLACGKHACEMVCHKGACPPCQKTSLYACRCKRVLAIRACVDSDYQCERQCNLDLSCKRHQCQKGCHSGTCGDCELAGKRSCPCGKVEYKGIACDILVPLCGSTCEKSLPCGFHKCQERCHSGPCNAICRIVFTKPCRCGSLKKQVPCHQDLLCDRKCQCVRDCTRHACKRRCCDRDCPPCSEVCGRRLRCGNHKCPAPCHRGLCAPCPVTVRIQCACGATAIEVPCGMERDQKPPRCTKRCQVLQRCSHSNNCKPHRCHYEACPPCQLTCNQELSCGHRCPRKCHGPRPIPNPEFSLKRRKSKSLDKSADYSGLVCPPCVEIIVKQCVGRHYGIERMMVCSEARDFKCENICGNSLLCGNHFCKKPCHLVPLVPSLATVHTQGHSDSQISTGQCFMEDQGAEPCEQCSFQCQKKQELCLHPCPLACHPGDCPPCNALIKRACYCETLNHVFDCSSFSSVSKDQQAKLLSCCGPCHRKLPKCAHMCPDICHPGPCPTADNCKKKVAVRCSCQRIKKDWFCSEVQAAVQLEKFSGREGSRISTKGLLECDEDCLSLILANKAELESELRQRKPGESEIILTHTRASRQRKGRMSADLQVQNTRNKAMFLLLKKWTLIICALLLLCFIAYHGVIGLKKLNDWMNKLDATRPRKRLPGSFTPPSV